MIVNDGDAARAALLRAGPFDVILCEVALPKVDGFELLQEMRSKRPDLARRMLFFTADLETRPARAIARLHVRPLLPKPFLVGTLHQLIDEIANGWT